MSRRSKVALLVMAAFVAFVEGPLNPFWIWNAMPIAVSYLVLRRTFDDRRLHVPGVVFAAVCCFLVVLAHIAWLFELHRVVGGSFASTPGLLFSVAPVCALLAGGVAGAIAWAAGRQGEPGNR